MSISLSLCLPSVSDSRSVLRPASPPFQQSIVLMHVHAADSGRTNLGLLRIAITNAQEMMLHRLGDKSRAPKVGEHPDVAVRRETAKRIW